MNKVKKTALLVLAATLIFSSVTVAQAKTNNVKVKCVSVKNTKKSVKVKVKITNNSKKDVEFGEYFTLHKKKNNGKWKRIEWKEGYAFHDLAYVVMPGGSIKQTFTVYKPAIGEKLKKKTAYKINIVIGGKKKSVKFKIK